MEPSAQCLGIAYLRICRFRSYVNCIFFSLFLMPWHLGLVDREENAFPSASYFIDIANYSPECESFISNQPNQAYISIHFLYWAPAGLLHFNITLPESPQRWVSETQKSPDTPELSEIIRTSQSEACLPCFAIPSFRNHNKGSSTHFLLVLCLLTDPGASLCGPAWGGMLPPLRNCM